MVCLGSDVMDLSKVISHIEMALHDYSLRPQSGLKKLQVALLTLRNGYPSDGFHPLFDRRLATLIDTINTLINTGSLYDESLHIHFLSATDALIQVALASQFSLDHAHQLDYLLSDQRDCWGETADLTEVSSLVPVRSVYTAFLPPPISLSSPVDDFLSLLTGVGDVSFHLTSSAKTHTDGYFKLVTNQSLVWLQSRFPDLLWQDVTNLSDDPIRHLCELSFLPLFQNLTMPRATRYRVLSLFEQQFQDHYYCAFESFFPAQASNVLGGECRVPAEGSRVEMHFDDRLTYFPVHHGGHYHIGSQCLIDKPDTVSYALCLGRDFLPHFLYQVSTSFGVFVFDQKNCFGRYPVALGECQQQDGGWWFVTEQGLRAQLLLSLPVFNQHGAYCCLLEDIHSVLVIRCSDQYFAVPYLNIREIEGVSSKMESLSPWVKNVWLTQSNESFVEPLLFSLDISSSADALVALRTKDKVDRQGYYHGQLGNLALWIDAKLVRDILPYQKPHNLVWDSGVGCVPVGFIIHDGECIDKALTQYSCYDSSLIPEGSAEFSVLLQGKEGTVVLPLSSFEWRSRLPDEMGHAYFKKQPDAIKQPDWPRQKGEQSEGVFLNNKEAVVNAANFAFFVAEFWPYFYDFKSDY